MQAFLASHHRLVAYIFMAARTVGLLALAIAVFAPLEHFFSVRKERFFYKGWFTNFVWYFVNSLSPILLLGPPSVLLAWGIHAALPAQITGAASDLPLWARMVLAMIIGEVGFYWGHRWTHEWPLLWRFHAVHHSAEHLHFLVNTRAHPIDLVFTRLCGLVLLYATGLASPVGPHAGFIPALVLFVGSLWSYFIHANVRWRLGPLEEVLSSPAFHHWHHTYEDHKDRNFSSMLPIMDRLFGTMYLPKHWPERYGTATPMPHDIVGQLLEPLAPSARPAQGSEASRIADPAAASACTLTVENPK